MYNYCIPLNVVQIFINNAVDNCKKVKLYTLSKRKKKSCDDLFTDNIILLVLIKSFIEKLLNKVHHWSFKNEMTFGINKINNINY